MARGVPTTSEDRAHETPLDPATACSHVEDRRVPGHVVRDAREALTTAGYKVHEARAAVERALTQLDDQVTLPQLIRQALRCCAIAPR
jgi:Holliday junction resolvasome RuvABC DNA-binding subunit